MPIVQIDNSHLARPPQTSAERIQHAVANRDKMHELKTGIVAIKEEVEKVKEDVRNVHERLECVPCREELHDNLKAFTPNDKFEEKFNEIIEYIDSYITNSTPRENNILDEIEKRISAIEKKLADLSVKTANDTEGVPKLVFKSSRITKKPAV